MSSISFRSLAEADFPLMLAWLSKPHIKDFYSKRDSVTGEWIEKKYGPRVRGEEPTFPYVILIDGEPVGYIQTYLVRDYPEYQKSIAITEDAAGLDLFIGDEKYLGRGLGPLVIGEFVQEIIFKKFAVSSCIAGPNEANTRSIRAFEKAGFKYLKTVHSPKGGNVDEHLMLFLKI